MCVCVCVCVCVCACVHASSVRELDAEMDKSVTLLSLNSRDEDLSYSIPILHKCKILKSFTFLDLFIAKSV